MPHVCRTCLCAITDEHFVLTQLDVTVNIQLEFCVPEMDCALIIDPVLCEACKPVLQSMYDFKHQCLQTEERIREIVKREIAKPTSINIFEALYGANNNAPVDSNSNECKDLEQQHLFSSIKQEVEDEDVGLNTATEFGIKIEEHKLEYEAEEHNESIECKPVVLVNLPKIDNEIVSNWISNENDQSLNMCDNKEFEDVKVISNAIKQTRKDSSKKIKRNKHKFCYDQKISSKSLQCDICFYTTRIKCNMKRHMEKHTGEKPFKCDECGFQSARKDNLQLHIAGSHSESILFNCKYCSYGTVLQKNLKRHMLCHMQEEGTDVNQTTSKLQQRDQRLHCDKCDYKTAYKSNLKIHLVKHNEEMPFRCEYCDYATAERACLTRHLMIHSGEKPYRCDKCDYKTSQKFHLKRHSWTHAKCKVCNYTTTRTSLKKHMKLHINSEYIV